MMDLAARLRVGRHQGAEGPISGLRRGSARRNGHDGRWGDDDCTRESLSRFSFLPDGISDGVVRGGVTLIGMSIGATTR